MKYVLSLGIVISLYGADMYAQDEFAPVGAKWTYSSLLYVPPDTWGPYTIEVVAREEFQGKLCSKIHMPHHFAGSWVGDPLYVYESNDSVYYWSPFSESFHLLYDFSAEIGDTIIIGGLLEETMDICTPEFTTIVDSISYLLMGNDTLKVWYFDLPGFVCFDWNPVHIIENIGCITFILPSYGLFEQAIGGLRCYSDSLHDYQFVPYSCDTVFTGTLGSKDIDDINEFISISPNPVSQSLHVISSIDCFDCIISVYSVQGQLMFQQKQSLPGEVDVSSLPEGMYIWQVQRGWFDKLTTSGVRSRGELFVKGR